MALRARERALVGAEPGRSPENTVAIVCAKNEAPRIGAVLDVLVKSPHVARVLVVDDGSTDDTGAVARSYGAEVLRLDPNRGKGQAMLAGVQATTEPLILFVDADLVGFTQEHVRDLVQNAKSNGFDMVVGMRDYGPWTEVTRALPLISGERCVRRSMLAKMPAEAWQGFGVEVAMDDAVYRAGGRTGTVVFEGLSVVKKWEKDPRKGAYDMLRMGGEVLQGVATARRHGGFAASVGLVPSASATPAKEAPPPASATAECSTTQCVADTIVDAAVRVAGPYVRDELWTPEARAQVGAAVGARMSRPLWVGAAALGYLALGPLGLLGAGALWLFSER